MLLFTTAILISVLPPLSRAENLTLDDSGCLLTDIESRLSIASHVIETARQRIPKDLKELCRKAFEYRNRTHHVKPLDCSDIYDGGERRDGLYDIWPQSRISRGPLRVYCDMESNGGGWTVIQRRGDYKSPQDYFYRDWNSYKFGFGDLLKDFWIGNDNLFAVTSQRPYHLRVNLTDWEENSTYAIYDECWLTDEIYNYTLNVKGYRGTAGNSLGYHDGKPFSTKDRNNDNTSGSCAVEREGAWWYDHCANSNLNGLYLRREEKSIKGITWYGFRGTDYSLKETVMKIRPASFNAKTS